MQKKQAPKIELDDSKMLSLYGTSPLDDAELVSKAKELSIKVGKPGTLPN